MIFCGSSDCAARTTYAINGRPPSSCSTLARFDFIRVPRPAAITSTLRGLLSVEWFITSLRSPRITPVLDRRARLPPTAPYCDEPFHRHRADPPARSPSLDRPRLQTDRRGRSDTHPRLHSARLVPR